MQTTMDTRMQAKHSCFESSSGEHPNKVFGCEDLSKHTCCPSAISSWQILHPTRIVYSGADTSMRSDQCGNDEFLGGAPPLCARILLPL